MALVVETIPHVIQERAHIVLSLSYYWWPGDAGSQVISSYAIGLVFPVYSGLSTRGRYQYKDVVLLV